MVIAIYCTFNIYCGIFAYGNAMFAIKMGIIHTLDSCIFQSLFFPIIISAWHTLSLFICWFAVVHWMLHVVGMMWNVIFIFVSNRIWIIVIFLQIACHCRSKLPWMKNNPNWCYTIASSNMAHCMWIFKVAAKHGTLFIHNSPIDSGFWNVMNFVL